MAISLRWLIACCLMLSLTGCFHSKRDIHTISHPHHSQHWQSTPKSYSHKTYHTVQKGDSLFKIGKRFGVPYKTLAKRNHLHYPYTIYVGQKIYLSSPSKTQTKHAAHQKRKYASKKHATTASIQKSAIHLRWPVHGRISSPFGRRGSGMHDGIDIAVKDGTPVHAAAAGQVVHADSRLSGYGKLIIIRHSSQLFTAYAHNQKILVKVGDRVRAGDVIAKSGHSGHSTGPHVHFEVRIGTAPVNPVRYLPRQQ